MAFFVDLIASLLSPAVFLSSSSSARAAFSSHEVVFILENYRFSGLRASAQLGWRAVTIGTFSAPATLAHYFSFVVFVIVKVAILFAD
jgi:hypothetical protein